MLPGRANRSHDWLWHLGQRRGVVIAVSGSKPQEWHWTWKIVVFIEVGGNGLYDAN